MSTDQQSSPVIGFADLGLPEVLLKAISDVGYETPSPIQMESIPVLLEGRDLLGQAQTGTGKTAAFALPLLSRLDPKERATQMLVLAPTRELAIQVAEAMQTYAKHLKGFSVLPIYGGQSIGIQLRGLRRGAQVVVGTPGRVIDHLGRGTLDLSKVKAFVLDEADEMLRMGFIEDVETILSHAPDDRQIALFSATLPRQVMRIAKRHLNNPLEIKIKTQTATVETINQRYWLVSGANKLDALTRILETEVLDGILIFVRTKTSTVELASRLEARGFRSSPLNGDMNQDARESVVRRLKNGKLDIVVATDVAARGLDVDRISHVVNFDIPTDPAAYVHRIGRTGRAGRTGEAILFVAPRERRMLKIIERSTRQVMKRMRLPTRGDVAQRRRTQFADRLRETLEGQDLAPFEELIKDMIEKGSLITPPEPELSEDESTVDAVTASDSDTSETVTAETATEAVAASTVESTEDTAATTDEAAATTDEAAATTDEAAAKTDEAGATTDETSSDVDDKIVVEEIIAEEPKEIRTPLQVAAALAFLIQTERPLFYKETERERRMAAQQFEPGRGGPRDDRGPRPPRGPRPSEEGMLRYRVEVGHTHGVKPGNLVAAIANEAGIEGRHIGHINIQDGYSLIDLPEGMPSEIARHLQNVTVCGQELQIAAAPNEGAPGTSLNDGRRRRDDRNSRFGNGRRGPSRGRGSMGGGRRRY